MLEVCWKRAAALSAQCRGVTVTAPPRCCRCARQAAGGESAWSPCVQSGLLGHTCVRERQSVGGVVGSRTKRENKTNQIPGNPCVPAALAALTPVSPGHMPPAWHAFQVSQELAGRGGEHWAAPLSMGPASSLGSRTSRRLPGRLRQCCGNAGHKGLCQQK